jgi:tetratricopeptide (TPR) repeat protein
MGAGCTRSLNRFAPELFNRQYNNQTHRDSCDRPLSADATHATSIDAYDGDAFVALAMTYNSLNNFENAMKAATQALALQPDSWQSRLEMAKSLYGRGQFDLALAVLNEVAKDFPDVHLVRGNVLMNLARRKEAVEEFTLFLREAPIDPRSERVRRICAASAMGGVVESASVSP